MKAENGQVGTVVLIEDDSELRTSLAQYLEKLGHAVTAYRRAEPAVELIDRDFDGVIVSDVRMPGLSGIDFLQYLQRADTDLPVILITAHGDVPMAVHAIQSGAYDFLEKPFEPESLARLIGRAQAARRLILDNRRLRARLGETSGIESILIGESAPMRRLRENIVDFATTDAPVLILGETGVGKELVARCLHQSSDRVADPFVPINCAAIPENLFEAELFGHEAGAFTGAGKSRDGYFQAAHRGTLMLDELGELPLAMQPKLLRALQDGAVTRVGATRPSEVDLRIVSATNSSLDSLRASGEFRDDLFYRLNTLELHVPPLREREGDALVLFSIFVERFSKKYGVEPPELNPDDAATLMAHSWPGNVRELLHIAERYLISSRRGRTAVGDLINVSEESGNEGAQRSLKDQVDAFERVLISRTLSEKRGDIAASCEALGVPRRTLNEKMTRHGLSRSSFV